MKAIVITVPEGFETAVVVVTHKEADGKTVLDTKVTKGKDTGWALDFSEKSKEVKT